MNERCSRPGCIYRPLTEQVGYFHQKVEDGLIDGYVDETGTWVPLP